MRIHAAPLLEPGRVIVMVDGEVVHDCSLHEFMDVEQPKGKSVDIYMNPDDAQNFHEWQIEDQAAQRRLN